MASLNLPGDIGHLDFGDWAYGLVSGFISGGASAVVAGVVVSIKDPNHYALGTWNFFEIVLSVFVMSGTMSAMAFLRTKPLPSLKTVVETTQVTSQVSGPPKVTQTIQETRVEAVTPKPE